MTKATTNRPLSEPLPTLSRPTSLTGRADEMAVDLTLHLNRIILENRGDAWPLVAFVAVVL